MVFSGGLRVFQAGGLFLESSDSSSAPKSRFVFAFKIKVSNINFENHIRLSVNEAKLTGFWASNFATIQQVLTLKFAFGPEKVSGLSRNGPLFWVLQTSSKKQYVWWAKKQLYACIGAFLYISLRSLQNYDVNFTFYGGRKQRATNFSFSLVTWMRSW